MKERPILFSGPMVKAILEGRKSQTRRVMKPQPIKLPYDHIFPSGEHGLMSDTPHQYGSSMAHFCPYGKVGDRLWVRETLRRAESGTPTRYLDGCPVMRDGESIDWPFKRSPWPSIFMPRWASRISLEITGVRVERLQEITEEDAVAEGCELMVGVTAGGCIGLVSARYAFRKLWDSINGKKYPWSENPWVWVIEFKRIEKEDKHDH